MKKLLSGVVAASGAFLLLGSVGGVEHDTMELAIGALLSFGGLAMIWLGLWLLENVCEVNVWD